MSSNSFLTEFRGYLLSLDSFLLESPRKDVFTISLKKLNGYKESFVAVQDFDNAGLARDLADVLRDEEYKKGNVLRKLLEDKTFEIFQGSIEIEKASLQVMLDALM